MENDNIPLKKKMIFFNKCFDKSKLKQLIYWFLNNVGEAKTLKLIEKLKDIGFKYATKVGVSISIDDLKIPLLKYHSIHKTEKDTFCLELNFEAGNITKIEKIQSFINSWYRLSENLKNEVVQYFKITDVFNPVYMMSFSGARGNLSQVSQLIAMRGLMSDPQGQILDFPIRSNFREGLTLTEYIISCYGARKGIVDTALRTAKSGYLTRRLVDVAHHVMICKKDCQTNSGIWIKDLYEKKKIVLNLKERIIGRVLAEKILYENSNLVLSVHNEEISLDLADKILKNLSDSNKKIFIRSPLTCFSNTTICQLCYGWNLGANKLVSLGEAIGVLAAQSIGEPGTQLTMRTFHTGGVFSGSLVDQITSPDQGQILFNKPYNGLMVRTFEGKICFLAKQKGVLEIKTSKNQEKFSFIFAIHTLLFVKHKEFVNKMQVIGEMPSRNSKSFENEKQIKNQFSGQIYFEKLNLVEKIKNEYDIRIFNKNLGSIWVLGGNYLKTFCSLKTFFRIRDLIDSKVLCQNFRIRTFYLSHLNFINSESSEKIKISKNYHWKSNTLFNNNNDEKIIFLNKNILFYYLNKILFKKIGYLNYLVGITFKKFLLFDQLSNNKRSHWYYKIYNKTWNKNILSWSSGINFKNKIGNNQIRLQFLNSYIYFNINFTFYNIYVRINTNNSKYRFELLVKNLDLIITNYFLNFNFFTVSQNRQGFKKVFEFKYIYLFNQKFIKPKNKIFKISKKINLYNLKSKFIKKLNYSIFNYLKYNFTNKVVNYYYYNKLNSKYKSYSLKKNLLFHWNNFVLKNNNFKFIKYFEFWFIKRYFFYKRGLKHLHFKSNFGFNSFIRVFIFVTKKSNFKNSAIKLKKYFKKIQLSKNWISLSHLRRNHLKNKTINSILTKKQIFFCLSHSFLRKKKNIYIFNNKRRFFLLIQHKPYLKNYKYYHFQKFNSFKDTKVLSPISLGKKYKIFYSIFFINKLNLNKYFVYLKKTKLISKYFKDYYLKLTRIKFKNKFKVKKKKFLKSIKIKSIKYLEYIQIPIKTDIKINNFFPILSNSNNKIQKIIQKTKKLNIYITDINYLRIKKLTKLYNIENKFIFFKVLKEVNPKRLVENELKISLFLNCQNGEVLKTTLNKIEPNKHYLSNWKNENISILLLESNNIFFIPIFKDLIDLKIGSFLRPGQKISKNLIILSSGQIIAKTSLGILIRKAETFLLADQTILHIKHKEIIEKNTSIFTVFFNKIKTGDIIQGIPKIEEIFEARGFSNQQKLNHRLLRSKRSKNINIFNKEIEQYIRVHQQSIVNKIQKIYHSQGVTIADKHIEIIVRQMTSNVVILNGQQTGLLSGELVNLKWIQRINKTFGANKLNFLPLVLGITRTCLETSSFISAASFQETTRILGNAAVHNKLDFIRGLKQNLILGNLIPAGTGFFSSNQISFFAQKKEINEVEVKQLENSKNEKITYTYDYTKEDIIFSKNEI
uniref:DNA-directed RNA polymerase subunit beta'' n=1 Tax=Avrainvillea mazei TaxID=381412 RepID=A0A1X9RPQ4_9CHLO|nr:RNA polymerase b-subunit [Avrainvillea mazei]